MTAKSREWLRALWAIFEYLCGLAFLLVLFALLVLMLMFGCGSDLFRFPIFGPGTRSSTREPPACSGGEKPFLGDEGRDLFEGEDGHTRRARPPAAEEPFPAT
ncbi:MAG: hypothetical protein HY720_10110 [Planctomycetes bacterium]|nr:hypothetical protein [Planctomycetota bacterium]